MFPANPDSRFASPISLIGPAPSQVFRFFYSVLFRRTTPIIGIGIPEFSRFFLLEIEASDVISLKLTGDRYAMTVIGDGDQGRAPA